MGEEVKLTIPAQKKWLGLVDLTIEYIAKSLEAIMDAQVAFAVREAVINAMCAAEKMAPTRESAIDIVVCCNEEYWEIQIADEGPGISETVLERLTTMDCADLLWSESGRGLLYIKEYMDEYYSEKNVEGKHVFTMRKKIGGNGDEKNASRSL